MKIYVYYETTDEPWGGLNSFFKSFKNYLRENKSGDIELVNDINDDFDVFLMGACSFGQGKLINYKTIKKLSDRRERFLERFFKKKRKCDFKVFHRLDGLRMFYNNKYDPTDEIQIKLSQLADHIIFQSLYSLENFRHVGYTKENYTIIKNGVNQKLFNMDGKSFWDTKRRLKVLSANWSNNPNKGYWAIADFSELCDVESYFVGNWPKEIDHKKVKVLPPMKQEELALVYKECDVFLHAAQNDPCPNVVLEAMSCGLPVIYHNSGGIRELAAEYGISLPERLDSQSAGQILQELVFSYDTYIGNLRRDHREFSIEIVGEKYINTFRKVLAQ